MSFGIFEAAFADDLQDEQRRKLASTRLAQAAADVDDKLGPLLNKSSSVKDYHNRVRLAEKDFRAIVGKYLEGEAGFIAVAKKLEPHYTKKRSKTSSRRVVAVNWNSQFTNDWSLDGSETEYFVTDLAPNVHLRAYPEWDTWYWQVWKTDERGFRVHVGRGPARNAQDAMRVAEEKGVEFMTNGKLASRRVANGVSEDDLEDAVDGSTVIQDHPVYGDVELTKTSDGRWINWEYGADMFADVLGADPDILRWKNSSRRVAQGVFEDELHDAVDGTTVIQDHPEFGDVELTKSNGRWRNRDYGADMASEEIGTIPESLRWKNGV